MADKLDFSFQVLQTIIRVIYGDLTKLQTDVLISFDDVYLSASSGVSALIWAAAGKAALARDRRKFVLPMPLGTMLVTGAGQLRVKYIFHALALDFKTPLDPVSLVPQIIRRLMELVTALRIECLAMPLFVVQPEPTAGDHSIVTELTGTPEARMLDLILRCVACYLSLEAQPDTLRELTIACYEANVLDHSAAEQQLCADLAPIRAQAEQWAAAATPINARVAQIQPLLAMITDDANLHQAVTAHMQADRQALHQLFGAFDIAGAMAALHGEGGQERGPLDQQEHDRLKRRLLSALEDVTEDINQLEQIQRAEHRRLRARELQQARSGDDTAPEILMEIEELNRNLKQRERELQQLKDQQQSVQRDIEALDRAERTHTHSHSVSSSAPVDGL